MRKEKGITLIALVITIAILIILAGISINILMGESSIVAKAKETRELQKVGELIEKLEIEKGTVATDHLGKVSIENYLKHIQEQRIIDSNDVETISEVQAYVTLEEKYVFFIEELDNQDLKITYIGELGKLPSISEVVKPGDYIEYSTQDLTTQQTLTSGYLGSAVTLIPAEYEGKWRVLENNGTNISIISEGSIANISIRGINGFNNLSSSLNTIASWYANEYATSSRGVSSSDVTTLTTNAMLVTGYSYWTTRTGRGTAGTSYFGYYIDGNGNTKTADFHALNTDSDQTVTSGMRPIIVLDEEIQIKGGNGTEEKPYSIIK